MPTTEKSIQPLKLKNSTKHYFKKAKIKEAIISEVQQLPDFNKDLKFDNEIIEYFPLTIEHLLKQKNVEPKDLYDLIPLLNQILNKYKQQTVGFIQSILMQFIN